MRLPSAQARPSDLAGVRDVAQEVSMGSAQGQPAGPDLTQGIASEELGDGRMLAGHVEDNAVLLARCGNEIFAVDAKCSHYGGPPPMAAGRSHCALPMASCLF